jgi:hypothetical protein
MEGGTPTTCSAPTSSAATSSAACSTAAASRSRSASRRSDRRRPRRPPRPAGRPLRGPRRHHDQPADRHVPGPAVPDPGAGGDRHPRPEPADDHPGARLHRLVDVRPRRARRDARDARARVRRRRPALGASRWRVARKHVLPNISASIIVLATLDVAATILAESSLSFLGLGVQPPAVTWGLMISSGREYLSSPGGSRCSPACASRTRCSGSSSWATSCATCSTRRSTPERAPDERPVPADPRGSRDEGLHQRRHGGRQRRRPPGAHRLERKRHHEARACSPASSTPRSRAPSRGRHRRPRVRQPQQRPQRDPGGPAPRRRRCCGAARTALLGSGARHRRGLRRARDGRLPRPRRARRACSTTRSTPASSTG